MRLAIVTPWFGKELAGGAERLACELAFGLRDRGHQISVFATCAASFHAAWNADAHPPGERDLDGLRLFRFRVDRTNTHRFAEVNRKLLAIPRDRLRVGATLLDEHELADFVNHNINSTPMLSHLARHDDDFDSLIFMPYLYGVVLRGWRIAPGRSSLVPCLHDEHYAYLPQVAAMMRAAGSLLFNSDGTLELARRLYGPGILPRSHVVGSGISWPVRIEAEDRSRIGEIVPELLRYVLYLGRRSAEKNIDLLLAAFERYCEYRPSSNLHLVLAGPDRPGRISAHPRVCVLHEVDEVEKSRLLRHCLALAQPSTNESFSRTVMEAWAVRRPVVVHADSIATAAPVEATRAGWKARDITEWIEVLAQIDASSAEALAVVGRRAGEYVDTHASWPRVLDSYEAALDAMVARRSPHVNGSRRIVHCLERAAYADSATILALQNDALLKRNGFRSLVVAAQSDERLGTLVASPEDVRLQDARIAYAVGTKGAAESAEAYVHTGAGLPRIALHGEAAQPFPLFVDTQAWNVEPSVEVLSPLQDGRTNVLAIAPIAPQHRQVDAVLAFRWYYTLDFDARLLLVGDPADGEYLERLRTTVADAGLEHRVLITGEVSRPALAAMYRSAHLFVSFRDSYDTGLSLLEAMAFDVPVCVKGSEQAREILAGAGVIIAPNSDPLEIAGLWKVLTSDETTRERVLASQRRRLDTFSQAHALALLASAALTEA